MLTLSATLVSALVPGPWSDKTLPPFKRATLLADKMTLDERMLMVKRYGFLKASLHRRFNLYMHMCDTSTCKPLLVHGG